MLADLGDTLVNTNEIRKISIEYVPEQCDKPWRPWEVIIRMADDKQERLSRHATEQDAKANLERLRCVLRDANCVIDLRNLKS